MPYNAANYIHNADRNALAALKAIPGFAALTRAFMKIWYEKEYQIINLSTCIRVSETQFAKYYQMLPPICEKLGIAVPEMFIQLDVNPNAYTFGDTNPFIVITSGLFETMPDELIPTVIAHECGHIACRHTLYHTMGNMLLNGSSALLSFFRFGSLISLPLEIAFFYWMRCSELSADRAAVLCDGSAEKMAEVCLRFAGFDKDIEAVADKEQFLQQAREYRELITDSKWNKTLEFFVLSKQDHPLTAVRALECTEWAASDMFRGMTTGGSYLSDQADRINFSQPVIIPTASAESAGKSIPDLLREYKALLDEGIITEAEFEEKKKQLLNS